MTGPSRSRILATLAASDGKTYVLEEVVEPVDRDAIASLAAHVAAMDPWRQYPSYSAVQITRYLESIVPGAPRLLIRSEPDVIGAVGLKLDWLRGHYLQFLAVLPAYQGCGIGAATLAWLDGKAKEHGARNLFVLSSEFNNRAIRFYERHGFRRIASLPDLVTDGITEIMLRKKLV